MRYLILAGLLVATAASATVSRHQVPASETWDLTPIYADAEAWERDLATVEGRLAHYTGHRGRLATSPAALAAYLRFDDGVRERLGRLELFARLSRDLDLDDSAAGERWGRVEALSRRVNRARAFADPEILAMPAERLDSCLKAPELADHRPILQQLVDSRRHILGSEQEELLEAAAGVCDSPRRVFQALAQQDLAYPTVAGPDGQPVTVGPATFEAAKTSLDRDFRARIHDGFFGAYAGQRHALAAVLDAQLQARIFKARARRYDSAMAASLEPDAIPTGIYRNLVATVAGNPAPLHRWMAFKKQRLGLTELHDYDATVTLFPEVKRTYTFDEARAIVMAALAPLGKQYGRDLQRAFDERWIDVRRTPGKSQGAYSSGATFGVHPYVLINWNGEVSGLYELAHELGHAMHAHYTVTAQPFPTAGYTTFAGEVASATNEALLSRYLIDRAASPAEERSMLEQSINNIKLMYYWTTLLADLEMTMYDLAEEGAAMTPESLCDLAGRKFAAYYGSALTVREPDTYIWAALRHVYIVDFYLYKYATGFAAAEQIADDLLGDPAALPRYLDFLRCGNSRRPVEALQLAGVDLTSTEPMVAVSRTMTRLLDQLEELAQEQ